MISTMSIILDGIEYRAVRMDERKESVSCMWFFYKQYGAMFESDV